jgi:Chaperone of endosialidase
MKQIPMTIMFLLWSMCPLCAQQDPKAPAPKTAFSGSGTTDYIPLWTGSTSLGNSLMYQTSTGIGIGTTSPQWELDVAGHINTSKGYMIGGALVLSFPGSGTSWNLGVGAQSLAGNTTGSYNTAVGGIALGIDSSGGVNTAIGYAAMAENLGGSYNTATGSLAMFSAQNGSGNVADGYEALYNDNTGGYNAAVGYGALLNNSSGTGNVAIGYMAASDVLETSNYNIEIGSSGYSTDNGTIRIGTIGQQTSFFVTGVRSVTTGENNAVPVVIDSNGQLGTVSSSRRFKTDIHDMGDASSGLLRLRPVTFRYKKPFADGSQPIQYGLIAEEVAEVYPDLVARSADGEIEAVKYQVLDSMLLNELQRQQVEIRNLQEQLREMKTAVAAITQAPLQTQTVISQTSAVKGEQQ